MLDDAQFVSNIDHGNALGLVAAQATQLRQHFDIKLNLPEIKSIGLVGMGGSALAGEFIRNWLGDQLKVPFVIIRDYHLPAFVNENTLLFVSSHSGNTEETLSAYEEAKARAAQLVVITAGGKLLEDAKAAKLPVLEIPGGSQPRLSVYFMVKAMVTALEKAGLANNTSVELEKVATWLESKVGAWAQSVPTYENPAKQLAEKLLGESVVIYGGPTLAAAAQKWKISINENAKNVAFYYLMSEFNHNEFQGWLNPQNKPFKVIELKSSLDHPQIAKRWDISNRLLSGKMPSPIEVTAEGETKLDQLLWTQVFGDFVGVYLGILNKVDPASVDLIEKLKKELG